MNDSSNKNTTKFIQLSIKSLLHEKLIEKAKRENTNVNDLINSMLEKDLQHMLKKKCKNCGKWFFTNKRSDELYCDNPAPKNPKKTCKKFASQNLSYKRLKSNPARDLHRKIYQQKARRVERNPDCEKYKTDLEAFKEASKEWKQNIRRGIATESEFLKWLKSFNN